MHRSPPCHCSTSSHYTTSTSCLSHPLFLIFLIAIPTPVSSPLSLHDALPISTLPKSRSNTGTESPGTIPSSTSERGTCTLRSEEHTSELQSLTNLVCRLLLEKKKKNKTR